MWSLQRSGDTLDAVYAIDNTTNQEVNGIDPPVAQILEGLDGEGTLGIYGGTFDQVGLLDTVALKEYLPPRDRISWRRIETPAGPHRDVPTRRMTSEPAPPRPMLYNYQDLGHRGVELAWS